MYFGTATNASAACSFGASSTIVTEEVSYVPTTFTNPNDPRSSSGVVHLMGWLYYHIPPSGTLRNAPVLIYNHGHEAQRGEPCEIARFFVNQKFVVFAPLRRGHYANNIASTGIHIDDYVNECLASGGQCAPCNPLEPETCIYNAFEMEYLKTQYVDVLDAITYIRGHASIGRTNAKLADPTRIAILGHSYGGALTVFANTHLEDRNEASCEGCKTSDVFFAT